MKEFIRRIKCMPLTSVLLNLAVLFFIYTVCRLAFYTINAKFFQELTASGLLNICIGGLKFDLTALLYLNSLYIVLALIPFKFRSGAIYRKVVKCIYLVFNTLGILANCYDMVYFQFINRRTTIRFFSEFQNDGNLFTIAVQGIVQYWYVTLIVLALIFLLYKAYKDLPDAAIPEKKLAYYPFHTAILCLSVYLTVCGIRGGFGVTTRPINVNNSTAYIENSPIESAIVLNTAFTMIKSIDSREYVNPGYFTDKKELQKYCNPHHYPQPNGEFKPDNVIIILIESFAREYVGFFYNGLDGGTYKGYTPFLDSLLSKSLTFKHSFATGKQSIDVMPSVLSGIPCLYEPYVTTQYGTNEVSSIAKYLKKKGYQSAFFHGAPNGSIGLDAYAQSAGIDKYYGKNEYNNDADFDGTWAIWDEEFMQYFANELDTFKTPFLGILFTATSHHPFKVPQKYEGKFPKGPEPMYECVGYTDYALRRFFETASKKEWFKNTLFVITADHTTVLTREDFINGRGLYDIPILFYHPSDSTIVEVSDRVFGQTDITPSILGYLNYDEPYFAFGKDIFDKLDTTNYVIDYYNPLFQIFQDSLLLQFDGERTTGVYNYAADLGLKHNIINQTAKQDDMEKRLKAEIQTYVECLKRDSLTIPDKVTEHGGDSEN
ncbi:MAG: sulfatase-like hydrolase/transferase [Paludibacteraceae bacterium]|nr:sulfatase-like hydrolase/transferase [Paludibacteraceae bacterium]MBQ2065281.1 sulfatase-like hydrolase/transferase [Paludibacteraceae bacterium]